MCRRAPVVHLPRPAAAPDHVLPRHLDQGQPAALRHGRADHRGGARARHRTADRRRAEAHRGAGGDPGGRAAVRLPGDPLALHRGRPVGRAARCSTPSTRSAADATRPTVLASQIVSRIDAQHAFLINRNKLGSMALQGESLFVLEMQPASYAILATNEAEKAAAIKVVDYRMIGATGRVYLSGRGVRRARRRRRGRAGAGVTAHEAVGPDSAPRSCAPPYARCCARCCRDGDGALPRRRPYRRRGGRAAHRRRPDGVRTPGGGAVRGPGAAGALCRTAGTASGWRCLAGPRTAAAQPRSTSATSCGSTAVRSPNARSSRRPPTGTRLVLGRGAVLTPLARDKARSLGVEIEKER